MGQQRAHRSPQKRRTENLVRTVAEHVQNMPKNGTSKRLLTDKHTAFPKSIVSANHSDVYDIGAKGGGAAILGSGTPFSATPAPPKCDCHCGPVRAEDSVAD